MPGAGAAVAGPPYPAIGPSLAVQPFARHQLSLDIGDPQKPGRSTGLRGRKARAEGALTLLSILDNGALQARSHHRCLGSRYFLDWGMHPMSKSVSSRIGPGETIRPET